MEKRNYNFGEFRTEGNRLQGWAAVFDTPAQITEGGRTFSEIVRRGAFKRAIEAKADIIATFNHNPDNMLGRVSSGTLQLAEDERGLFFSIDLPQTAAHIRELVQRGDLRGASITFSPRKNGETWKGNTRELTDLYLYELGPVVMPAQAATSIGLRSSLESWRMRLMLAEKI